MQVILSTYFSTDFCTQFILCDWFYAKIIIWPFSSKGYLSGSKQVIAMQHGDQD